MKDISKYISVSYRRTHMFINENLKPYGITSGQYMFILGICENPGCTQEELSQHLLIDKSTCAKVIGGLESSGYVRKQCNETDRREYHLFPTEKALEINPKIIAAHEQWHRLMTENLTEIECDIFGRLMEKVMENAVKNCK
ncbi:MAG: MarR family winged helix-turn-helix transcriptional regulator [Anaerofustis sp.]